MAPAGSAPYPSAPYPGAPVPGAFASAPRTGAIAWGLGFLVFVPFPIVGLLATVITVVVVGLGQRKHGGVAAANGVNAANWALTFFLLMCVGAAVNLVALITAETGSRGIPPLGVLGSLVMVAAAIANLVILIVGAVKANRGEVYRGLGIPFFRV